MVIPPPLSCQNRVQHMNINIRTALMSYRLLKLHPILYTSNTKTLTPNARLNVVGHSRFTLSRTTIHTPTVKLPCWDVQISGAYPRGNLDCLFIHSFIEYIVFTWIGLITDWQLIGLHEFNICRIDSSVHTVTRLWAGLLRNWDLVPVKYQRLLWSVQTSSEGSFPMC